MPAIEQAAKIDDRLNIRHPLTLEPVTGAADFNLVRWTRQNKHCLYLLLSFWAAFELAGGVAGVEESLDLPLSPGCVCAGGFFAA